MSVRAGRIVIAGAGIAGLSAAIALARAGVPSTVLERSARIDEVGAGLQLSPNATRIFASLDVLPALAAVAVRPDRVLIRKASSLRPLASVPLGAEATARWGAPYLTVHRADLQSALLATARRHPEIGIVTGAAVRDAAFHRHGVTLSVDRDGAIRDEQAGLVIGADGVWSTLRGLGGSARASRDTGFIAWRAMIRPSPGPHDLVSARDVSTFVHPGFHLVAYPVRGGDAINLVAVTPGRAASGWNNGADRSALDAALEGTAPELRALVGEAGPWTTWPIHEAPADGPWTSAAGIALIGDAAHAMTPYAAQGAAMAIEDAATLAALVARAPDDVPLALARYEKARRPRIRRVAARGRFNRFTWHASGPAALARDLVLSLRPSRGNVADLDWLYGWTVKDALRRFD